MNFERLSQELKGDFFTHTSIRRIYATDASAYRQVPEAVALPRDTEDLKKLIHFAREHKTSLIPRTAGTSLAGQVVGGGIVVDVSKHFNQILEINTEEGWAWVQPGIVRDDLNRELSKYGMFFAPETSTANRAMIGGMIGNNSCGANSIVYGSTREHLLETRALLSNGEEAHFGPNPDMQEPNSPFVNQLYRTTSDLLSDPSHKERIVREFPKSSIPRRNTGYALDMLLRMKPFDAHGEAFNFCSLLAGSEGTLAFVTAAKIKLTPLPPNHVRLVCVHCESITESLKANLLAVNHHPTASELMDHYILEATARNPEQRENRFFVKGDPKAILAVELRNDSEQAVEEAAQKLVEALKKENLGYHFPIISGPDINRVWTLRKAGLGALSNVPGDAKAAPVIEDTAVDVNDLPDYIAAFNKILDKHDLFSVHYAHAGSGELHLRPILNLKTEEGVRMFRTIAEEIAALVKEYQGSLSGEHGDGRLRGEFIPNMIGKENYELLREVKRTWDPDNIFNPGKIVDTPPMDTSLRYEKKENRDFDTVLDFDNQQGILRSAELCNGSGDCRKSELTGGTMCPSYMATRDEKDTTRARANILREFLTRSDHQNPFDHPEIKEVMDLCLSCKGCKKECPSNVDLAKLKAEWQYQYYQTHGAPFRAKMIASYSRSMAMLEKTPWLYNLTRNLAKPVIGFAKGRSIPKMAPVTLRKWFDKKFHPTGDQSKGVVYFFFDEFTNYLDVEIGKKAIQLLDRLGYKVVAISHSESGRAYLSKGFLKEARRLARKNVTRFHQAITKTPGAIVGIEPSAILTFRDEYPDLLRGDQKEAAKQVANTTYTIEEFLAKEIEAKNVSSGQFSSDYKKILVHGHCHQKAISGIVPTKKVLAAAENFDVQVLPTGCCGMAGSFGYEKEHFDISMKIGELVLFPKVRQAHEDQIIVASGTSCRHQIWDGTGKKACHIVEVL